MQTIKIMEETLQSESGDIALYLAMSRKAHEEGHEEISLYLRKVAMDEAVHAAQFAGLLGKLRDTKSNLEMMLDSEIRAEKKKAEAAQIALFEGHEEAHRVFERTMRDETSHKEGLKKAILKLHEKD
ncbi:MAG: rubrerythrin family protein [Candidatus Methanoperedens sp.]|jgi:rubrerythrin|nr:rubrerythrin family protein [Candidatus Methanoperedens sp.]PKL54188.1 MAG: rubrerythrin family protein [Candidatus Methanoperedenaceae archaeon HGW-Methanoperedenaceae-1]